MFQEITSNAIFYSFKRLRVHTPLRFLFPRVIGQEESVCVREREEFTLFHLLYSRDKINKVKSNISFFGEMLRYPQTDSAMKMNFKFFNR